MKLDVKNPLEGKGRRISPLKKRNSDLGSCFEDEVKKNEFAQMYAEDLREEEESDVNKRNNTEERNDEVKIA